MLVIKSVKEVKNIVGFLNDYDIIGVGTDTRNISIEVKKEILKYIKPAVIDFKIISTPMAFFASIRKNIPVLMITGSSLSKDITGFKFIYKYYYRNFEPKPSDYYNEEKKDIMVLDIKPIYLNALKGKFQKFDYSITVDPNGGTGIYLKPLLNQLFNEVNWVNDQVNQFNHELTVELTNLTNFNGDFYIVLDPDADQIGIYTKERFLDYKLLTYIFVEILCKRRELIVVTPDFPEKLLKVLAQRVDIIVTDNPHNVAISKKAKFYVDGYKFGFKSWYYIPDGIHTFLMLLKYLKKRNIDLQELIKDYDSLFHK